MIAETPGAFLTALSHTDLAASFGPETMRAALLVEPSAFRLSDESARDNEYMDLDAEIRPERAIEEHRELCTLLHNLGLPVITLPGKPGLDDAVFPNNVYATVPGAFIIGRMRHAVRRREAERADVRRLFSETFGYELRDLSGIDGFAELTGPLAIDRRRGIGFCGMTDRVDEVGCRAMHAAFGLRLTYRFDLAPGEYHTNLVLAILAGRVCVLHRESFADSADADAIAAAYPGSTLLLSDEEKAAFAGNCIACTGSDIVLSATAKPALRRESIEFLNERGFELRFAEVTELEKGGGSLRCLIAEIF